MVHSPGVMEHDHPAQQVVSKLRLELFRGLPTGIYGNVAKRHTARLIDFFEAINERAALDSHSPGVIPFGVTEQPLRAIFHNGHFLGDGAPVWEIRKTAGEKNGMLVNSAELGQSLAQTLGSGSVVLMRGHGDAVAGPDLKTTVFRAIYTEVNARLQMQAVALGGPINFLNKYEQAKSQNVDRPWDMWRKQVGAG